MKILHNYTCELCGSVKKTGKEQAKLNVHHLIPDNYDDVTDHNNFSLLCSVCHEWVEHWVTRINGRKFAPPPTFDRVVSLLGEHLSEPARSKALELLGQNENTKETEEMKSFSKNNEQTKEWQDPSEKVHVAILIGIFDVGTQKKYQSPEWEEKRTIILRFELIGSEKTAEGKNFIKDKQFKWSNHSKSGLMSAFFALGMKKPPLKNETELGGWYDIPANFKYESLLGKPCLVQIEAKQNGNGTKIGSITPIVEGMTIGSATNPLILLDWDHKDFETILSACPPYISNMVLKSQEMVGGILAVEDTEGFTDDVPI